MGFTCCTQPEPAFRARPTPAEKGEAMREGRSVPGGAGACPGSAAPGATGGAVAAARPPPGRGLGVQGTAGPSHRRYLG